AARDGREPDGEVFVILDDEYADRLRGRVWRQIVTPAQGSRHAVPRTFTFEAMLDRGRDAGHTSGFAGRLKTDGRRSRFFSGDRADSEAAESPVRVPS